MGFWNTPTLLWGHLWCTKRFQSLVFDKDPPSSSSWGVARQLHPQDWQQKTHLRAFLQTHFGTPPTSPILDIPEEHLLGPKDALFYVSDNKCNIIGCVRYHHLGQLESNDIYLVDCFCIHPQFRKRGLADHLLTTLHCYANKQGIPYALFLREGPPLPIWSIPLYTSHYVYKRVRQQERINNLHSLTPARAHRLLEAFSNVVPNSLIIRPSSSANQCWRFYRDSSSHQFILACVQDSYQWLEEANGQRKKMGWITAWLESSVVTDECRARVLTAMTDSMEGQFDYVWANKEWLGTTDISSTDWKEDGTFHWYAYQWATTRNIKNGYCFIH